MSIYTNDWDCYSGLLADALAFAKASRKPTEIRMIFTPRWEHRSAADLTLLPSPDDLPLPVVTIRSGSRAGDSFDLTFSMTSERGNIREDELAARGWRSTGPGPNRTRTYARNESSAREAAIHGCSIIAGLSRKTPVSIHAEGDDSGLLRSFVTAIRGRHDEFPADVTPVLYRDIAPEPQFGEFSQSDYGSPVHHGSP